MASASRTTPKRSSPASKCQKISTRKGTKSTKGRSNPTRQNYFCAFVLRCFLCTALSDPDESLDGLNEFLRIVTDAIFENDLDVFNVTDRRGGIAFYDHQVGLLAHGGGTQVGVFTQELPPVYERHRDWF